MFFRKRDPLDAPLHWWDKHNPFRLRHLHTSVAAIGQTGSGKTSGSGLALARAVLRTPSGGIICASKNEDRAWWQARFDEAGRRDDLVIFSEDSAARCNVIEFERACGGDALSLTQLLTTIGEVLDTGSGGKESEKFWKVGTERVIYNSVCALMQGHTSVDAPSIMKFISSAAYKSEDLADEEWLKGFHPKVLNVAFNAPKGRIGKGDMELYREYFIRTFPSMENKVRSSFLAGVENITHVFNTGLVREMISGETNFTPLDFEKGKWLLIDFSVHKYAASGRFIMAALKFITQKYVLRRTYTPGQASVIVFADEAQNVVNSFDSAYLNECRSHGGGVIYLTQSIHNLFNCIDSHGHHKTLSLLSNFKHVIAHSLGDHESAKYFSDLLGQRRKTYISPNMGQPGAVYDRIMGQSNVSVGVSERYEQTLQPSVFLTGLRNGGPENRFCVDGVILPSGQPFSSGQNYLFTVFKQR